MTNRHHASEPHHESTAHRTNWLRAGVLGANDGIISEAGLVIGVAAASTDTGPIATAGIAGLVAGAVSMALGEYVSVSTQRDSEKAVIRTEERELHDDPEAELHELRGLLRQQGLSHESSHQVADELTEQDALGAHLRFELGMERDDLANPWSAAFSSAVSFTVGALLPLVAILVPPPDWRIPISFVAVIIGLVLTGTVSARLGRSPVWPAVRRLVLGGVLAMLVTMGIGELVGTAVG